MIFGVAAAFLFGTEEGRKIVKKGLDSLPEKYKNPLSPVSRLGGTHSTPLFTSEETPHHTTVQNHFGASLDGESPPPPPPSVRPVRPEPFKPSI